MFRFIFCAIALLPLSNFADEYYEEDCCPGKRQYRATVRHIESGGIGYEDGYTTFEMFLASDPSHWSVTPFLDARGHVFDNGKWAANAGIGLRALWGDRVYGINTYYDYRNTGHFNANQLGAGLETLGELFDFRINGYLPLGNKVSSPYGSASAGTFSGNFFLVSQKYQAAMKGANAEFGFHFGQTKSFDFYAAAGPYYFIGEGIPAAWGGKARISGTYRDFVKLEFSDSYDRTFHNKFQGEISFGFSFGPKSKVKANCRPCEVANTLNNRMLQSVDRQEIIVVGNGRKNVPAIDPATGLPFFFVFVDNTSSSNGTFESPYHNFAQAEANSSPNDIIYVFPGDGTTTGMDSGLTLKASQMLWGSGISHPLQTAQGLISVPALTSTAPIIENTDIDTLGYGVILATNNTISGLTISTTINDAVFGEDPQNLTVSSCLFEDAGVYTVNATFSGDASVSITDNQFVGNANGLNFAFNGTTSFICTGNTFEGQTSTSEVPIQFSSFSNVLAAQIENNIINENVTGAILIGLNGVIDANLSVVNNTITLNGSGSRSAVASSCSILPTDVIENCSLVFNNNKVLDNAEYGLFFNTGSSTSYTNLSVTASNNVIDTAGGGLIFATPVSDILTIFAIDNSILVASNDAISITASGTTGNGNLTINNNNILDIAGNGISVPQSFTTVNLNIVNNTINGCDGTGILAYSNIGLDTLTVDIAGNAISNCANMGSNAAGGIDLEQYTNLAGTVANNTLTDNAIPGVFIGSTLPTPVACLNLTGNISNTDYTLTNPGDGCFKLSPVDVDAANTGTITQNGTFTPVSSCPSDVPCPP